MSVRSALARLLYDRRYGVETSQFVDLSELGLDHPERIYYSPAHWGTVRRALASEPIGADDTFLDLGCGKGRMVLEAATLPFGRVLGLELSPDLVAVARTNLARTRLRLRAGEVLVSEGDVLVYEIPDDVNVVFMNNPFRGEVFAGAVKRLLASIERRPREVTVLYFNAVEEDQLLRTGRCEHVRSLSRGDGDGLYGTTRVYRLR